MALPFPPFVSFSFPLTLIAVASIIHAPTGEKMFPLGRMSAFVPVNVPVSIGMLIHGPTSVGAAMFWQFVNQTCNMVNNHANRASKEVDTMALSQSYLMAVVTSMGIAYGAGALMRNVPRLKSLGVFVPYFAVITAGTVNLCATRWTEVANGIEIFAEKAQGGHSLGVSQEAGKYAVFNTIITRILFLPMAPLLIPPLVMKMANLPAGPLKVAVEVGVIALCMGVALPCALALQPQVGGPLVVFFSPVSLAVECTPIYIFVLIRHTSSQFLFRFCVRP